MLSLFQDVFKKGECDTTHMEQMSYRSSSCTRGHIGCCYYSSTHPQLFEHDIDVALNNSVWQIPDKCSVRRFIWERSLAAASSVATPIAAATSAASTVTATVRVAFSAKSSGNELITSTAN